MKRVSFKIAKAIKDAGYPQDKVQITEIGWYNQAEVYTKELPFLWEGDDLFVAVAPTYIEVWLWLWREKKKWIDVSFSLDEDNWTFMQNPSPCDCGLYNDPEEAIIAAIEYLVDNDLLK